MRRRPGSYPAVLARFRVTPAQAAAGGAGRGLVLSGLVAVAASLTAVAGDGLDRPWFVALALPVPLGAVAGLALGCRAGVDADHLGLHRRSVLPVRRRPPYVAWRRVIDIRAERHGARTVAAVYLDTGPVLWLPAPYEGRFLTRDPRFEWKLFTLRNLWETHRSSGSG